MEISRLKVPESAAGIYAPPSRALDTKPALLWINLTREIDPSFSNQFLRFCDIRHLHPAVTHHYTPPTPDTLPDVLVFEYDYPDMDSLNVLRQTHQQYPHIPIIMFTLHHSEELAIWALRNQATTITNRWMYGRSMISACHCSSGIAASARVQRHSALPS